MIPNACLRTGSGAWARSPTVDIPSDRMRVASLGPTPHSFWTSLGQNSFLNACSSMAVNPRGRAGVQERVLAERSPELVPERLLVHGGQSPRLPRPGGH